MAEIDAGVLPVGDNDRLVGMITDRDIAVRAVAQGKGPDTPVRRRDERGGQVLLRGRRRRRGRAEHGDLKVRRLPVLNQSKRLVGIVSLGDLASPIGPENAGEALCGISEPGGAHSQSADKAARRAYLARAIDTVHCVERAADALGMRTSRAASLAIRHLAPLLLGARPRRRQLAHFYAGKTFTVTVGFSPGGIFDLYARILARHIGAHIPGKPNVIVQNLPGAGGRRLANAFQLAGPNDGTAIGITTPGIVTDQVMNAEGVQYDLRKFHWIGSPADEVNVLWVWHTTPVRTIDDVRTREVPLSSTGQGSPNYFVPRILNQLMGTKFKVITGYPGANEADLAIERGEVAGRVSGWTGLKNTGDWVAAGKTNVLVQQGLRKAPELTDKPLLPELGRQRRRTGGLRVPVAGAGARAAVLHAARNAARARRRDPPRVRGDHEGPGLPRRDPARQARRRTAHRRRHGAHRGESVQRVRRACWRPPRPRWSEDGVAMMEGGTAYQLSSPRRRGPIFQRPVVMGPASAGTTPSCGLVRR